MHNPRKFTVITRQHIIIRQEDKMTEETIAEKIMNCFRWLNLKFTIYRESIKRIGI